MSDSCDPMDWGPSRLLCPWDFPGKNTEMVCHFLLRRISLRLNWDQPQGLNCGLLHCRQTLYWLSLKLSTSPAHTAFLPDPLFPCAISWENSFTAWDRNLGCIHGLSLGATSTTQPGSPVFQRLWTCLLPSRLLPLLQSPPGPPSSQTQGWTCWLQSCPAPSQSPHRSKGRFPRVSQIWAALGWNPFSGFTPPPGWHTKSHSMISRPFVLDFWLLPPYHLSRQPCL